LRSLYKENRWLTLSASILVIASASCFFFFRDPLFSNYEHIVLSLQGSTSLGDELMPQLAAAFLRDEMGAQQTGFRVAGKDAKGHSYLHVWGRVPGRPGLQVIQIFASGSGAAFACLAAESGRNACDIGMASRPINDLDKESYPALRNLGDRATEHVVALDGIAIIVNPHNPVSQLSIPELRAIYTGQITNWRDVGGIDAAIELYGRDRNSGTFEMFTEKVIGKDTISNLEASDIPPDHQIGDSGLIVDSVMRSANAIGYVSSPMIKGAKALSISDGSGPAFPPTELSIVTEDYPICRRLLLYDWDAPGSLMNAFVRYVVYKPGQTLVQQTPFVELTPKIFAVVPPKNAPVAYKNIASKYSRIGLSFHFSSEQVDAARDSTNQLDNLARVNVLRLRTFLAQHGGTGDDILLIGFADEHEEGVPSENLAQKRAGSVATSLRAIGVIVPSQNIREFGAELPVASNETPEGRRKNRRVEVWVRNGRR
jgi:phosphate transport system substrate-binding protein